MDHGREVKAVVGVAHHVGVIQPYGLLDLPIIYAARLLTEFHWIDDIQDHLDFCGINYYGNVCSLSCLRCLGFIVIMSLFLAFYSCHSHSSHVH